MSVRRFNVLGKNIFSIVNKILGNENIRKLLKNTSARPLEEDDVAFEDLIHKNVLIIPKIPENDNIQESFIVVMLDEFVLNPDNPEYKTSIIRFDIICPYDNWILDYSSLRPYAIMNELDKEFNEKKLEGIGNLKFVSAERLVVSPYLGGYSLLYASEGFN